MIEFKGTTEEDWLKTPGHRVKDIINRLIDYKKNNPEFKCPFAGSRKK
jgi:hypothetical protein